MQIGSIGYRIPDVEPDAEPDSPVWRMSAVVSRHCLLHRHGTTHRSVDAVEYGKQRVAGCLDDSTAILLDCRIDDFATQHPQPPERSHVIDADQAAVTNHIGIKHDDKLSPI